MPELPEHVVEPTAAEHPALPAYEPPRVLSYRGEESWTSWAPPRLAPSSIRSCCADNAALPMLQASEQPLRGEP